jgi:hypothetical protein
LLLLGLRHRIQLLLLLLLLLLCVRYGCQLLLVVVRLHHDCSSGRLLIMVPGSSLWRLLQFHGSSLWLLRGLRRCPALLLFLAPALLLLGWLPLLSVALGTSHWGWWHGSVLVRRWCCHPCCCCWWHCRRCCCWRLCWRGWLLLVAVIPLVSQQLVPVHQLLHGELARQLDRRLPPLSLPLATPLPLPRVLPLLLWLRLAEAVLLLPPGLRRCPQLLLLLLPLHVGSVCSCLV